MAGKRMTVILSHLQVLPQERDENASATLTSSSTPVHRQELCRRTFASEYLRQKQDSDETAQNKLCSLVRNHTLFGGCNIPELQVTLQSLHRTNISQQVLGDACSEQFLTDKNSTSKVCFDYVVNQDSGVNSTLVCSESDKASGCYGKDSRSIGYDAENMIMDSYSSEIGCLIPKKLKDAKQTDSLTKCSDLEHAIQIRANMLGSCGSHQHRRRTNVTIPEIDRLPLNNAVLINDNMASTSHSRTTCNQISVMKGSDQNSQECDGRVDKGSKASAKHSTFGPFSPWSFPAIHSHYARSKLEERLLSENGCKLPATLQFSQDCVFCDIVQGRTSAFKLYEDDHCICILDINPLCYGHSLIIPKYHFPSLEATPPQVAAAMCAVVPLISKVLMDATQSDAFNVVVNNGIAAGQVVFHTHFHIVPRSSGDGLWTAKTVERKTLKSFPDPAELVEVVRSKLPNGKSKENF